MGTTCAGRLEGMMAVKNPASNRSTWLAGDRASQSECPAAEDGKTAADAYRKVAREIGAVRRLRDAARNKFGEAGVETVKTVEEHLKIKLGENLPANVADYVEREAVIKQDGDVASVTFKDYKT